jgi:hypothetical protein
MTRAEQIEALEKELVKIIKELSVLAITPEWEIPKYFPVWVDSVNSEGRELAMFKCDFSHPRVVIDPAWEMVPDLLGLPDRVNWIAMEENGTWWGYEKEPFATNNKWVGNAFRFHFHPHPDWQNSKIKRRR